MHIRSRSRDRSRSGGGFFPGQLFFSGAQGAWYDPSDYSTLYQDAAGTTPVTAVEQPVRLMLDRSKGLVLGSELVNLAAMPTPAISNFGGSVGAWDASTRTMSNTVTGTDTGYPRISFNFSLIIGRTYQVAGRLSGDLTALFPNPSIRLASGGTANSLSYNSTTGVFEGKVVAASNSIEFLLNGTITAPTELTIEKLSIRELPGNHALAPNDASRPVLRARYNLLTRTEEFDDAAWTKLNATVTANAAVAPDGTTTADTITENAANDLHVAFRTVGMSALTSHTLSVYLRAGTRNFAMVRVGGGGYATAPAIKASLTGSGSTTTLEGPVTSSSITAVGNGWYRVSMVFTSTAATLGYTPQFGPHDNGSTTSYTGDGVSGVLTWGAQLLTAADQSATGGAYQRVGAATDYDTGPPWRPYLAFDGSDDSMSTSSIDFSGTDEITLFAGVSKLSDAATAVVAELSANSQANNGSFDFMTAVSGADYRFRSVGTASAAALSAASYAAPITNVLTGIGDISGDVATLRVNGVQAATSATDQGTGNYGNYPLFIGRRNNTNLPFNGRLYGLTVLGRTATAPELTAMESWIAGKTGVTI